MEQNRPNVIVITTDQQRKETLGCYGSSFVNTPNLDHMAQNGVKFERAYCTNPVCTPSRASMLTGKYVSNHGAWNIGTNVPEKQLFLPELFKTNGYRTHAIGKLHLNAAQVPPGKSKEPGQNWEEYFENFTGPYLGFETIEASVGHTNFGIKGHYGLWVEEKSGKKHFPSYRKSDFEFGADAYDWEIPIELHNNTWVAERSVNFLKQRAGDQEPFFLNIGFEDPHHPHCLPLEVAETVTDEYLASMPLPKYSEGELEDKPPYFQLVREGRWGEDPLKGSYNLAGQQQGFDYRQVSERDARLGRAYYYKMVEMIDDAVGEIFDQLDELGLADNTIVVFTSDHGELLGDHGIWMKGPLHYEELVNVPFVVQWKNHIPADVTNNSISSLVDLAPTLLSLCHISIPEEMDGKDCSSVWMGEDVTIRKQALIEYIDEPGKLQLKTIVTTDYKLTYYTNQGFGELYDLKKDPEEMNNLWNMEAYQGIKSQLLIAILNECNTSNLHAQRISYA